MIDFVNMAKSDSPELSASESEDQLSDAESESEMNEVAPGASLLRQNSAQPNSYILQSFWGLASVKDDERRANATTLLINLRIAQASHNVCLCYRRVLS
jgi:hypothetical protein